MVGAELTSERLYGQSYEPYLAMTHWSLVTAFYKHVLPGMNQARRKGKSLSQDAVMRRIWVEDHGKPGEASELMAEIFMRSPLFLTPQLVTEIADMTYLVANPNCPPFFRDSLHLFFPRLNIFEGLRLCNAKYSGRADFQGHKNIKEAEVGALGMFVNGMTAAKYRLFLDAADAPPPFSVYRLWLSQQRFASVRILLDQAKEIWPF